MNDTIAVTYRYGVPSWVEVPPELDEQFRLAGKLHERLVWLHYQYEEAVSEAWAAHPVVAATAARVTDHEAAAVEIAERIKKERQQDRSTKPRPESKVELTDARRALREAKADRKEAKGEAWPDVQAAISDASAVKRVAVKDAYGDFCQRGRLYWATYNDVVQHHKTTVAGVAAKRKAGAPAELRYPDGDGCGTVTVQLQRGEGQIPRTPQLLASESGPWRNVVQLSPWVPPEAWAAKSRSEQRQQGRGFVTFTVGGGRTVTLPVIVHRMLPAEADVTLVRVTRAKVGGSTRLHVTLVALIPAPVERRAMDQVSVGISWHSVPQDDGRPIRVARMASASGEFPPVPHDLRDVLYVRGGVAELFFHHSWRHVLERVQRIQSHRDELLDTVRPALVAALTADDDLARLVRISPQSARQMRSQERLAQAVLVWPACHPLRGHLDRWRHRDRHLRDFEAHERDQVLARRRDAYRKTAEWLCRSASTVGVSRLDIAGAKRTPDLTAEDTHPERGGRRMIQTAAPGELETAIRSCARRLGVQYVEEHESPMAGLEDGGE